ERCGFLCVYRGALPLSYPPVGAFVPVAGERGLHRILVGGARVERCGFLCVCRGALPLSYPPVGAFVPLAGERGLHRILVGGARVERCGFLCVYRGALPLSYTPGFPVCLPVCHGTSRISAGPAVLVTTAGRCCQI